MKETTPEGVVELAKWAVERMAAARAEKLATSYTARRLDEYYFFTGFEIMPLEDLSWSCTSRISKSSRIE